MSTLAQLPTDIARPFAMPLEHRFTGWSLGDDAYDGQRYGGERHPLPLIAHTLDAAAAEMTRGARAKDAFLILEQLPNAGEGEVTQRLHTFVVKVRRAHRFVNHVYRVVSEPYAVRTGTIAMDAFRPRRPFDAVRDDAVTGRQPGEARVVEVAL